MAEYINRETILNDLDIDIKVTNKKRLLAKDEHCTEDRMRYAKKLDHLIGFREYIKSLPTTDAVEREKIDKAIEEMDKLASHKVKPISFDQAVAIDMCIEILKRNIGGVNESSNATRDSKPDKM